jgi:hypothetical protein
MKRGVLTAVVAMSGLAVFATGAAPAIAQATLRVSWTLPSTANAGAAIPFNWSARHVSPHSQIAIQRQEGTARVWRTVLRLPDRTGGSAHLSPLPLGSYNVRMAVSVQGRLITSRTTRLLVFGQVPFSQLFAGRADTSNGVMTLPTATFNYSIQGEGGTLATVSSSTCRAVHVDYVAQNNAPSGTVTMSLVQQSLDPVSSTTNLNTIGSLDGAVVPGQSWSLTYSTAGFDIQWYGLWLVADGYADCYSTSPVAQ